jgi:hypothetical protein
MLPLYNWPAAKTVLFNSAAYTCIHVMIKLTIMTKKYFYLTCLAVGATLASLAQGSTKGPIAVAEEKRFNNLLAGDATISAKRTELVNGVPTCTYDLQVPITGLYTLQVLAPLAEGRGMVVDMDGSKGELVNRGQGWQLTEANFSKTGRQILLTSGKHQLRFSSGGNQFPVIDQWSLTISGSDAVLEQHWNKFSAQLQRMATLQPASNKAVDKTNAAAGSANKVLANPAGTYAHQVDESFAYTTFLWYYLTAGTTLTIETKSSTADPVVHLFNPYNIDAESWAQDDFAGSWESKLTVTIPTSGTYCLVVRPYASGASGITNIYQNGVLTQANTPIGGRLHYNSSSNTGDLNFFTCQFTGTYPDTRLFTLNSMGGLFTGYNDDYYTAGDYYWGRQSRIKKNFAVKPSYAFVCAYSTSSTGSADTYMGCTNSNVYTYFVNLKQDDAIEAAPETGYVGGYNCISWSGGITASWQWPPYDAMNIYYLPGDPLGSFDRYYNNTPVKRYSGAANYTRSGATQANAIVDLWAYAGSYTHASVRKPGNSHPHGYDWESKPGGTARTFHPRNGLNGAAPSYYGDVVGYYIPTGTFAARASGNGAINSDKAAMEAGFDVADKAALSTEANSKLEQMNARVSATVNESFNKLYNAWQATWQANQIQSDPMRYYQNAEGEALLAYCKSNREAVLPLVFSRYLQGNAIANHLLSILTMEQYGKLLEEVKSEYLANPYDRQGRYIVNNAYCNGIRYIEKILRGDKADVAITPVPVDRFTVQIAPNPVKEAFNIQVDIKKTSTVSIQLLNAQTGATKSVKKAITLLAGTYRFAADIRNMNFVPGSLLTVQVTVNDVTNTYKVITAQ